MYIAIDIGGTKTTIAGFKNLDPKTQTIEETILTSQKFDGGLRSVISVISHMSKNSKIKGIGVGFAGVISDDQIYLATNLKDWEGNPLVSKLKSRFKTKVKIFQDSACALLGEYTFEDLGEYKRILYLTIGTGLGNAFLWKTQKDLLVFPMEMGSVIVESKGRKHTFFKTRGTLESYVSGANIEKYLKKDLNSVLNSDKIWNNLAAYLAIGINNAAALLNPEVVIFAGGIIDKRPFLVKKTFEEFKKYKELLPVFPKFTRNKIKGNPILQGALALLRTDNLSRIKSGTEN